MNARVCVLLCSVARRQPSEEWVEDEQHSQGQQSVHYLCQVSPNKGGVDESLRKREGESTGRYR